MTVLGVDGQQHSTGIPTKRDFSVSPLKVNDPELLQATLTADPSLGAGTWSITTTYNPPGALIALWTDQKKTAKFFPSGLGTMNFYIEGVHESSALNDVTLTFQYTVGTPPNQTIYSASAKITVTPLINTFGVTPNADAGDANKQNVVFDQGNNANSGLDADTPSRAPGALFKGVALKVPLRGDLRFIHNVGDVENGFNGTKNNAGAKVGWLYANGTSSNVVLINDRTFPLLDFNPLNADQTYALHFSSTLSPDGNTLTITDDDAPATAVPANPQNGVTVDLGFFAQLYLVWRWIQNVGGTNVSVFYPLAYTDWQVNFYAKGTVVNGVLTAPINRIIILNGVSSQGSNSYTRSNDPPGGLDPTRFFNGSTKWQ
jgi:hypothetical protein